MPDRLILGVASQREVLAELGGMFSRSGLEWCHTRLGKSGLLLAGQCVYDLIVVSYPLEDIELDYFVKSLRRSNAPSKEAPFLILCPREEVSSLEVLPYRQISVVGFDASHRELEDRVAESLSVSKRASCRFLVEFSVGVSSGRARRLWQAHDISEGGMLLRTSERPAMGTKVDAELHLPDAEEPARVKATVVRHAVAGIDGADGIGLSFEKLEDTARDRLQAFMAASAVVASQRG